MTTFYCPEPEVRRIERRPGDSYLRSTGFENLAPKSKITNKFYIDRLSRTFGEIPIKAITRPVVVALREANRAKPWYCAHLLAKLRLLLQHGVDTARISENPALKPGGVRPRKRHHVLSDEQIDRLYVAAKPRIRLAVLLLLFTAQRPGDVLAMRWSQIQRNQGPLWQTLRQQKTGELIRIPAHSRLAAELEGAANAVGVSLDGVHKRGENEMIVPSPRGLPWAYRNFCRAWDRARKSADWQLARELIAVGVPKDKIRRQLLKGYQRRDFRRTAMVRMAEAGATAIQIAAVSGHTIDATTQILDTYIPRRGDVAAAAIGAWESSASEPADARRIVVPRSHFPLQR